MKRILLALLSIPLTCAVASASWQDDFNETYISKSPEQAVELALENGIDPDSIVKQALTLADLDQHRLVKALFCSAVNSQEIRDVSAENQIPDNTVTAGYKLSLKECRDAVIASQGYTPVTNNFAGSWRNRSRQGRRTFGSPSTFQ